VVSGGVPRSPLRAADEDAGCEGDGDSGEFSRPLRAADDEAGGRGGLGGASRRLAMLAEPDAW
jgi:hypothetical protein